MQETSATGTEAALEGIRTIALPLLNRRQPKGSLLPKLTRLNDRSTRKKQLLTYSSTSSPPGKKTVWTMSNSGNWQQGGGPTEGFLPKGLPEHFLFQKLEKLQPVGKAPT